MEKQKFIFTTNRFGAKRLHDDIGFLGEFTNTRNDIIDTNEGLQRNDKINNIWVMVVTDPKKAERIKNLSAFKNGQIKETNSMPMIGGATNLKYMTDPNKFDPNSVKELAEKEFAAERNRLQKENADALAKTEQMKIDMRRYGQLSGKLVKKDGSYVVDADPELLKELKQLKEKYGLVEEKVSEEVV